MPVAIVRATEKSQVKRCAAAKNGESFSSGDESRWPGPWGRDLLYTDPAVV
jgi:hypothetical protein